jgi:hypothetical protein
MNNLAQNRKTYNKRSIMLLKLRMTIMALILRPLKMLMTPVKLTSQLTNQSKSIEEVH